MVNRNSSHHSGVYEGAWVRSVKGFGQFYINIIFFRMRDISRLRLLVYSQTAADPTDGVRLALILYSQYMILSKHIIRVVNDKIISFYF
jgi:hypothetical protein